MQHTGKSLMRQCDIVLAPLILAAGFGIPHAAIIILLQYHVSAIHSIEELDDDI